MIRQALGRGVLQQAESDQLTRKPILIDYIESTLSLLLPVKQNIRPKLAKIIDEAIDIANVMTQEKAIFLCKMIIVGSALDHRFMELPDEDQKGDVIMCTFPLFSRKVMDDEATGYIFLIKAEVELENAFQIS